MYVRYEDLEELCETLSDKVSEANEKIRKADGDLTGGDLQFVDTLSHALKSIVTILAMAEPEGYSHDGYQGYAERYHGNSYARNARRDSRGRYSRDRGYSRGEEVVDQLREVMDMAPDDKTRQEIQRLINKLDDHRA